MLQDRVETLHAFFPQQRQDVTGKCAWSRKDLLKKSGEDEKSSL